MARQLRVSLAYLSLCEKYTTSAPDATRWRQPTSRKDTLKSIRQTCRTICRDNDGSFFFLFPFFALFDRFIARDDHRPDRFPKSRRIVNCIYCLFSFGSRAIPTIDLTVEETDRISFAFCSLIIVANERHLTEMFQQTSDNDINCLSDNNGWLVRRKLILLAR